MDAHPAPRSAPDPHRPRTPFGSGSRRVWGVRIGAVAVAAAALTALAVVAPWGGGSPGPTAVAAALTRAADSAGQEPAITAGLSGKYVDVRIQARWSVLDESSKVTYLQDQVSETWTPADGSGTAVHRVTYGGHRYLLPGDAARLSVGSRPPAAGATSTFTYAAVAGSFADPTAVFAAALPSDVAQLYARVRGAAGGDTGAAGQRMLIEVGNVLGFAVATPKLRSALYQVVITIPGVRLVPDTTDYTGRRGTTVAVTVGGDEQDLIFDPSTGEMLGQREVLHTARPGIPAGTVVGWSAFRSTLTATAPTS